MSRSWFQGLIFLGVGGVALGLFSLGGAAACKPSCAKVGGPSKGPADAHCGAKVAKVDPAVCHLVSMGGGGAGSTTASTGSTTSSGGAVASPYGPTIYGTQGDDDDCKYHVVWSATPICTTTGVTFTAVVTSKTDGKPVTGAGTLIEAVLGDTHSSPDTGNTTEDPPGTYKIGPVKFDEPGKWTVRFHIHEECTDVADTSQHGHAAFFVDVP